MFYLTLSVDGRTTLFPSSTDREIPPDIDRTRMGESTPKMQGFALPGSKMDETKKTNGHQEEPFTDLEKLISSMMIEYQSNTGESVRFNRTFNPPVSKAEGLEIILEDAEKQFTLVTGARVSFLPGGSNKIDVEGYIQ